MYDRFQEVASLAQSGPHNPPPALPPDRLLGEVLLFREDLFGGNEGKGGGGGRVEGWLLLREQVRNTSPACLPKIALHARQNSSIKVAN